MEETLYERIDRQYTGFTKTFRKITDYLRLDYSQVLLMSAKELSEKFGVSDTSIIRYCKALGYDGYPDFKADILASYNNGSEMEKTLKTLDDFSEEDAYIKQTFQCELMGLNDTINCFDFQSMRAVVSHIETARRIFIMGLSSCGIVANCLYYYLNRYQLHCTLLVHGGFTMFEELNSIGEDDLFFLVSYPAISCDSLHALELAHKRNAHTVLLCNGKPSPLDKFADYMLAAPSTNPFMVYNSYVGAIALCNILVQEYAQRNQARCHAILEELREMGKGMKLPR